MYKEDANLRFGFTPNFYLPLFSNTILVNNIDFIVKCITLKPGWVVHHKYRRMDINMNSCFAYYNAMIVF